MLFLFVIGHNTIGLIFGSVSLVSIIISGITFLIRPPYEIDFRNAKDARFVVFQQATIFIEGDINYIYFKVQEAIREKKVLSIEADYYARTLEAYRKDLGPITFVIETVNENAHCYSINVDVNYKTPSKIEAAAQVDYFKARSAFINQFIGKLLTKEVSSGDKDNKPS